jgi:hypothetical protein
MWPFINNAAVLKLVIAGTARDAILSDLEEMNVTARSLFPGFDGFARSLRQDLRENSPSPELSRRVERVLGAAHCGIQPPLRRRGE